MLGIVSSVKGLASLKKVSIDDNVFRIHYKATVAVLIIFSIIVTSKQYLGDPIDCIVDKIPPPVMDTYCWIYSTFTIVNKLDGKISKDIAHPGVGPQMEADEVKYHKYYQWVCFVLMFQAIMFYVPHYLWKAWENGRVKTLVMGLNDPIVSETNKEDRIAAIVKYFQFNTNSHNLMFYKYILCELMNLTNVVGQFFFIDFFLGGEFLSYGHKVLEFNASELEGMENPMVRVFPKVTKCTFHKYGPSGTVQNFDGICVLPVNIINEKIYTILWFWFVILIIITVLNLVYKIFLMSSKCTRVFSLSFGSKYINRSEVNTVVYNTKIGDWFLLNQLRTNMDDSIFGGLIKSLSNDSKLQVY